MARLPTFGEPSIREMSIRAKESEYYRGALKFVNAINSMTDEQREKLTTNQIKWLWKIKLDLGT